LFTPQTLLQEASAWHTDHAAKHAAAAGNRGAAAAAAQRDARPRTDSRQINGLFEVSQVECLNQQPHHDH
jgi:hypothetical protein